MTLKSLRYYGGKHADKPVGNWIASLLPYRSGYGEPFCGQAGLLLRRKESRYEFINDMDKFIYTWWKVVRDNPQELARKLKWTPLSEAALNDAYTVLDNDSDYSDIEIAVAVTVKLTQSYVASTGLNRRASWLYDKGGGEG